MKATVYRCYGSPDVLKCEEIEKPAVGDDEVLLKVRAASVNPADWHLMEGKPFLVRLFGLGLLKPKDTRLGRDVAGQVEAVGKNITQFKPGNAVFGACRGAFADKGQIQPGQKVLINGAAGGVGTFAVQMAKSFCAEVPAYAVQEMWTWCDPSVLIGSLITPNRISLRVGNAGI